MQKGRMLFVCVVLALGLCSLQAASPDANIVYNLNGTLGPNLNGGPDCLGGLNAMATASATASSTLTPTSTGTGTATYTLPAGAITASVGTITFTSTAPWSMKYTLSSTKNTLTLSGPGPLGSSVTAVSTLVAGSFPKTVLGPTGHPRPLVSSHSPQNLTSPSSVLSYSLPGCSVTKLGFTGTIASVPAAPVK